MRLIEREPSGVVQTLNAGLEAARGELVVQLDGDASVETPGWLDRMVAFFATDPRVGVVTGKIVFDWGQMHTCGVDMIGPEGFHDRGARITEPAGHRTDHQRVERVREEDCTMCGSIAEVDGGIGCCMMYRRAAALELGGYDLNWSPVWFDDLDLTMCLRREGLKVFYLPEVRVIHHVGLRSGGAARARTRARRAIGRALPPSLRYRISYGLGLDKPPEAIQERLRHHYGYWREKWGFDILNPDMDEVLARWGDTEVCWRYDEGMRAAGERIIEAYRS
jgi:GT2 family glycosyltransferase